MSYRVLPSAFEEGREEKGEKEGESAAPLVIANRKGTQLSRPTECSPNRRKEEEEGPSP